jgi:hypothetical protein
VVLVGLGDLAHGAEASLAKMAAVTDDEQSSGVSDAAAGVAAGALGTAGALTTFGSSGALAALAAGVGPPALVLGWKLAGLALLRRQQRPQQVIEVAAQCLGGLNILEERTANYDDRLELLMRVLEAAGRPIDCAVTLRRLALDRLGTEVPQVQSRGRQIVGLDLHRRRSVLVRATLPPGEAETALATGALARVDADFRRGGGSADDTEVASMVVGEHATTRSARIEPSSCVHRARNRLSPSQSWAGSAVDQSSEG